MSAGKNPVFVERETYRLRRRIDAIRLLPIVGAALLAVPLLWPADTAETVQSSRAILYIFGIWLALIGCGAFLSRRLGRSDSADK